MNIYEAIQTIREQVKPLPSMNNSSWEQGVLDAIGMIEESLRLYDPSVRFWYEAVPKLASNKVECAIDK